MLAATFAEYGPPNKLTVGEMPLPTPGAGELLVRVAAAGLNPIDCRIRSGELRHFLRVGLPFVSGSDIAGIVEAAGPGANRFHAGDAVFAMLPVKAWGGYAEYALVSETMAAPAPAGITLSEAASVPLAALTALQSLRDKAGVSDGCEVMRISVVALLCAVGFAVSSGSGTLADEKADLEKEVKKFQLIWTFESSETGGELAGPSNATHKHQDNDNQQDQPDPAAGIVAIIPTVRPSGKRTEEQ